MSQLAENLKALRGTQSQAQFAKSLGIKQQTYANYELGIREPDIDTLIRIAKVVGKPIDALVGLNALGKIDHSAEKVNDLKKAIIALLRQY